MSDSTPTGNPNLQVTGNLVDALRQFWYPAEFRIAAPPIPVQEEAPAKTEASPPVEAQPAPALAEGSLPPRLVAELATCLWYLKTKHFKRAWDNEDTGDDDPRTRRTLGRLSRGIRALNEAGIQLVDPTRQRYPAGGESLMRPIEFLPTPGVSVETVSDTVTPIIFVADRLIQRGEVFVAVPLEETTGPTSEASSGSASSPTGQAAAQSEPAAAKAGGGPTPETAAASEPAGPPKESR